MAVHAAPDVQQQALPREDKTLIIAALQVNISMIQQRLMEGCIARVVASAAAAAAPAIRGGSSIWHWLVGRSSAAEEER